MQSTLSERVKLALAGPPKRSQVDLARACGIKPPSVNDWVTGKTKTIEGSNLLNAAAFLQVNPKWLAEGIGPMRPSQITELPPATTAADPVRQGLGMRLKAARHNVDLSLREVADALKVDVATVTAWEEGAGDPGVYALRDLSKLYKTSSESLLWENAPSNEAMQIAAAYDGLDDRKQQTFRTLWMAFLQDAMSDERVGSHLPPAPPHELDSDFGALEPAGGPGSYKKITPVPGESSGRKHKAK
jgi:transcriptional regulator with XRE-family HTH domain